MPFSGRLAIGYGDRQDYQALVLEWIKWLGFRFGIE